MEWMDHADGNERPSKPVSIETVMIEPVMVEAAVMVEATVMRRAVEAAVFEMPSRAADVAATHVTTATDVAAATVTAKASTHMAATEAATHVTASESSTHMAATATPLSARGARPGGERNRQRHRNDVIPKSHRKLSLGTVKAHAAQLRC